MPNEKDQAKQLDRRNLLKGASLALGVASAAAATKVSAAPAKDEKPKATGYSETDHVRTYYKLARF